MNADRAAASRAFEDAILTLESALSKIEAALHSPLSAGDTEHVAVLDTLAASAAPLLKRQQAFNAAMVREIRHQRTMQQALLELIRCQASLAGFLRTVKPYIDTREFADVLRAMAEEDLKRSDALLARDRRRELQLTDVEAELTAIRARLDELQRALAK